MVLRNENLSKILICIISYTKANMKRWFVYTHRKSRSSQHLTDGFHVQSALMHYLITHVHTPHILLQKIFHMHTFSCDSLSYKILK
jgi:hypothetical protein